MPDRKADVAIVGGGLAGLAAADRLARCGARVVLLDDNAQPGGQYLRGGRAAGGGWDPLKRRGLELIDRVASIGVDIRRGAEVLGIEPGFELLAAQGGELSTVRCERVLLATGARERFMPFPGWTLPGVMSTGAAQILIKQSGVLPARQTLVGGAGLFLNAVAGDILKNGGRVSAVVDEAARSTGLPRPGLVFGAWRKFAEGGAVLARLLASRTPMFSRTRIVAARGDDCLREVVTARVDRSGEVVAGTERTLAAGVARGGVRVHRQHRGRAPRGLRGRSQRGPRRLGRARRCGAGNQCRRDLRRRRDHGCRRRRQVVDRGSACGRRHSTPRRFFEAGRAAGRNHRAAAPAQRPDGVCPLFQLPSHLRTGVHGALGPGSRGRGPPLPLRVGDARGRAPGGRRGLRDAGRGQEGDPLRHGDLPGEHLPDDPRGGPGRPDRPLPSRRSPCPRCACRSSRSSSARWPAVGPDGPSNVGGYSRGSGFPAAMDR